MAAPDPNQIAKIRHVLTYKEDYYQMLSVSKNATEAEIKSAYRKASLMVHPDRCSHPQATEAFKHLGLANSTLADESKRRVYDQYGVRGVQEAESGQRPGAAAAAEARGMRRGGNGAHFHFGGGGGVEAELFEEIFSSLFMDPRARARQRARHPGQQQQQQQQQQHGGAGVHAEFNANPIIAFLPFILFFLFAILLQSGSFLDSGNSAGGSAGGSNSWGASRREQQEKQWKRSLFSLSRSTEHFSERMTTNLPEEFSELQVPYFVGRGFEQTLARNHVRIRVIEIEVLRAKKESLERRCSADVGRGVHHTGSKACIELGRYRQVRT